MKKIMLSIISMAFLVVTMMSVTPSAAQATSYPAVNKASAIHTHIGPTANVVMFIFETATERLAMQSAWFTIDEKTVVNNKGQPASGITAFGEPVANTYTLAQTALANYVPNLRQDIAMDSPAPTLAYSGPMPEH